MLSLFSRQGIRITAGLQTINRDKHPHTLVTSLSYATKKRPFDSQFQVNVPSPKEMFFPAYSCDARHMRE
jgi:hypothetical protein